MGVKSFYKWLVQKYPKIVVQANGIEFDNLYIDMNEIIHSCFHPDLHHPSPPVTYDDVFINIYDYIDHIFSIVQPRNLLYLSIDGVSPRGKMNQQRTRLFRTANDTLLAEAEEQILRKEFEMQGKKVLTKQESEVSDSNAISPGTEFMFLLSTKLQDYIISRISCHSSWKNIKVIISDANVAGEGEHKMISFIKQQRTLPDYNPNTLHCLYGQDSDLIMLALATHEVHLSIMREDVISLREPQYVCMSDLQTSLDFFGLGAVTAETKLLKANETITNNSWFTRKSYQFLQLWILREYLEIDFQLYDPPENFTADIERLIDDFIFMCFFVGNDFLPSMPALQIYKQGIDLLMTVYKTEFKNLGGYLVDMQKVDDQNNGYVNLERVEHFFHLIGTYEEMICKRRSDLFREKCKMLRTKSYALDEEEAGEFNRNMEKDPTPEDLILQNTKELKETLKARLRKKYELFRNGGLVTDTVKPGSADWREGYYEEKFSTYEIDCSVEKIVQKYTEGLLWLLLYYFSEVPSWTWFYPYHYAPFASDMKGLGQFEVKFHKGLPYKPFDRLLAVLPPTSSQFLPKAYQKLMTDENSNIIDLYPTELEIDTDGKHYKWQGICKLPFVDEERLFNETRKLENELESSESQRNVENVNKIFMSRSNMTESQLLSLVANLASGRPKDMMNIEKGLCGIGGSMRLLAEERHNIDFSFENLWNYIMERDVLILVYEFQKRSQHIPRPLPGVEFPKKSISEDDIKKTRLWHENPVHRFKPRFKSRRNGHFTKASTSNVCSKDGYSSHFTNSRLDFAIHKGAGIGWAGRGAKTGSTSRNVASSLIGASCVAPSWNINLNSNEANHVKNSSKWRKGGSFESSFWPSRMP